MVNENEKKQDGQDSGLVTEDYDLMLQDWIDDGIQRVALSWERDDRDDELLCKELTGSVRLVETDAERLIKDFDYTRADILTAIRRARDERIRERQDDEGC